MNLDRNAFDLGQIFEDVARLLAPEAVQKGLRVSHLIASDVPRQLLGDPTRLRQILTKLAGNAVKFTERGSVEYRAELISMEGDAILLRIEVKDTGVGISPETQLSILAGFIPLEEAPARNSVGTCLSLPLCRQVVEFMGGSIGVRSEVGVGTVFQVDLKLGRVDPRPFNPLARPECSENAPLAAPLLILLAEDQLVNRMVACKMIRRLGCEVVAVEDGLKAIEALRSADYDLLLMDIQMPGMGGLAATVELRRLERETGRHLPVIAMLANDREGDGSPWFKAGMDDFITKPIHAQSLREILEKWGSPESDQKPTSSRQFRWEFLHECCGSNSEIVNEVLQSVLDSVPRTLESIQQAIATIDLVSVRKLVHLLQGSCLTIGADLMVGECENLRQLLRSSVIGPIEIRVQQLVARWQDLRLEILLHLSRT